MDGLIIILSTAGVWCILFFFVRKWDMFLQENTAEKRKEANKPDLIVLEDELSEEEMVEELIQFRRKHVRTRIYLQYLDYDTEITLDKE